MIAAVMSLLSFAVLSPHRVSANVKRGVMLSALALMAVLAASSARADYPAGRVYYRPSFAPEYSSAQALCNALVGVTATGASPGVATETVCNWTAPSVPNGSFSIASYIGRCWWGGTMGANNMCSGNPVCPAGQSHNGTTCAPVNCGPRGTYNPATNTCTCDSESYRASIGGSETCVVCPSPGYILGESPTVFSGQGEVPGEICLEYEQSIGGSGCSRETQRSVRQGTSYAAIAMRWTGNSCTVQSGAPEVGPPDASPDNPNSPDDCLAAGKGYITTNGQTQCVQNGTDTNPVTTTTKGTATNSDGSKTVTTTTTTSTTNNTHTSSTSVTYNNGNTQGEGDKTETSETSGGAGDGTSGEKSCGAPGQPACRVTITGGTGEGENVSAQLPNVGDTFDGDAEKGLLGGPLDAFLGQAQAKLQEAVFLPELSAADCTPYELWEGVAINFCNGVEIARDIFAWLLYIGACWFAWAQLTRALDRGAQ